MAQPPFNTAAPSAPPHIEVDGQRFAVRFDAEGLEVETASGERVRLYPWRLEDHLRALDRRVDAGSGELRFDQEGFGRDVLLASGVSDALSDELWPLALWWATGGVPDEPSGEVDPGIVELGWGRARVRPWTFGERARALAMSTSSRPDGAKELRLERYLQAMLDASVVALDAPDGGELTGASASALLDAAARINASSDREEDRMARAAGDVDRLFVQMTLRVCRAVGWTPSQVWEAPAIEIDRLLALAAALDPPASTDRRPSLADHPDAVVITVEET